MKDMCSCICRDAVRRALLCLAFDVYIRTHARELNLVSYEDGTGEVQLQRLQQVLWSEG